MLPIVGKIKKPYMDSVISFLGYNGTANIELGEMPEMLNLCADEFPCISPRPSRELIATLENPQALYAFSGKLMYVDGTSFVYDGAAKGTVTAGKKCMVEFQKNILIFPDKKYYNTVSGTFGDIGDPAKIYPETGACPDMDYVTVLNNRVWGCKGRTIYCCKLGDFQDWTKLGVEAGDAFAVDVASEGDFVGASSYGNHVQFYKKDVTHELFGDKPSNFQVQDAYKKGVLDNNTVAEVNAMLFSLWRDGVNVYTGGQPITASLNLGKDYVSGVAGSDGRKYYLSLYDGSEYHLFVYDSHYKLWHKEDNLNVIQFATLDGYVYALCADGKLLKFNSGNEEVAWEAYTHVITENYAGKKGYSQLTIRADLAAGSSISVYTNVNNEGFQLNKTYSSPGMDSFVIPLAMRRADHFQIKIAGTGKAKIHQIQRRFFVGSGIS